MDVYGLSRGYKQGAGNHEQNINERPNENQKRDDANEKIEAAPSEGDYVKDDARYRRERQDVEQGSGVVLDEGGLAAKRCCPPIRPTQPDKHIDDARGRENTDPERNVADRNCSPVPLFRPAAHVRCFSPVVWTVANMYPYKYG